MSLQTPFPVDPVLTAISLAYRNRRMIADAVLPRLTPMNKQLYQYYQWSREMKYTVPESRVGRGGKVKQVEFNAARLEGSTKDEGLEKPIPFDDIANAAGSVDVVGNAAQTLTDLIALGREVRVAAIVHNEATYPVGNKVQLSGNTQWNDPASKPLDDINAGLLVPLMKPNVMVLGEVSWTALRSHAQIMTSVNRVGGESAGNARQEDVAALFGLDRIEVGPSFVNQAKKGQTVNMARVWGKHCALIFEEPLVTEPLSDRITFGWTAQYMERVAGQMEDEDIGLRGGIKVRVGESLEERVVAADLGYFIEDAAA